MAVVHRERGPATEVGILVVGAGACGLIAALAAHDAGAEVVLVERDATPAGSTALSSGFIPACGTRWQAAAGVTDDADTMAGDIQRKNHGASDPAQVRAACEASGPALEWLAERHGLDFELLDEFLYPGHSVHRMHAHPARTGEALIGALLEAVQRCEIPLVTSARVEDLLVDPGSRVLGASLRRPDGAVEELGCRALVLACNGFGGNPGRVRAHIPEMAEALYFGHAGNQGDAVAWGEELGAGLRDLGAYQGHGSVAHPHGVLMTWALMMQGGIQVNAEGRRFSNEHAGYSEQAMAVLAQPGGVAWNVYDRRLHEIGLGFEDYRQGAAAGAVREVPSRDALAGLLGCDVATLSETLDGCAALAGGTGADRFGRDFTTAPPLSAPPYSAVRVTGALFHTQGGLVIDTRGRVLRPDGSAFPNLLAGGGAAVGVSGSGADGYLSGNGLLTAVAFGRLAGRTAAGIAKGDQR